ncbi:hypothetical protein AB3G45_02020 [Shinella sp. S4-D37]|uniref:hypothetical protein n=1 Tax=Shinella sp. S4-D37 TaxID=3161999 RepID=UPI00346742F6
MDFTPLRHRPFFKENPTIALLKGHGVVRQRKGLAGVLDAFQVAFRASPDDVAVLKSKDRAKLPLAGTSDFGAYFEGESAMRDRHDRRRSFDNGVSANAGDPRTREQARAADVDSAGDRFQDGVSEEDRAGSAGSPRPRSIGLKTGDPYG